MRRAEEVMSLIKGFAAEDERIRVLTLEGSRVNPNVTADVYQDYDVTFLVREVESFRKDDGWLSVFGKIAFMQKPEAMDLFPSDFPESWFSYLIIFEDGVKVDLTLVPVSDVQLYLKKEPLVKVIVDKDGLCRNISEPTDERFWVEMPPKLHVIDCSNEFYMSSTYVKRAILRGELLFANEVMNEITRTELLRMLGYLAGTRRGFPVNTGKRNRYLTNFLNESESSLLMSTYKLDDIQSCEEALRNGMVLFDKACEEVCANLSYMKPGHGSAVKKYFEILEKLKV